MKNLQELEAGQENQKDDITSLKVRVRLEQTEKLDKRTFGAILYLHKAQKVEEKNYNKSDAKLEAFLFGREDPDDKVYTYPQSYFQPQQSFGVFDLLCNNEIMDKKSLEIAQSLPCHR